MRIIISIGHPAHVHYFKNAAKIFESNGHKILFFIRDRECIVELVSDLGFDYVCYGRGGDGMLSKLFQIPVIDYKFLRVALRFKPDIFLSFSSPYAAHVSKMLGKPHIALDDTDHAKLQHLLYRPFTDAILSPYVYSAELHKRQILFDSFLELLYLDKRYFSSNLDIFRILNISESDKYCVVRFVSWDANHDVGYKGLTVEDKCNIVKIVSKYYKVFISSEGNLPVELEEYRLSIPPSKLHDAISYSSLCISEGSTTASEAAVLGVPTIYVNPLNVSYCDEEERYGILHKATKVDDVIEKIKELSAIDDIKKVYSAKREAMLSSMIDPTALLVWFVESYPQSRELLGEDVNYQKRFK